MSLCDSHSSSSPPKDNRIAWEGCSVLLDVNDGDRLVFARLTSASTLKIGKKNYSLLPLIGCPFGSEFQVDGSKLSRALPSAEVDNVQTNGDSELRDEIRDNREIVDNNKAQGLSGEDIEVLRSQGVTGNEIIEALIANSATFEKKTAFSQEKYRLKKQKKYAPKVLMRRPFTRSICEAYFLKYPDRIGHLRVDTLSLLLSLANVSTNSDVVVVDMVGGLLTGAVAERLGSSGYVCNMILGKKPHTMDIVRMFNFSDDVCQRTLRSSLEDFSSAEDDTFDELTRESCETDTIADVSCLSTINDSIMKEDSGAPSPDKQVPRACKSTKAGNNASKELIESWKKNGFSSLVIAAPERDPWIIAKDLLPLTAYSAPFAIYFQYLQPLANCMHNLQVEKMAIGLQITEPWLREYQVLPSRTHPCMQMSAFGGYILSGTRIFSPPLPTPES
ncbi:hypothetical protein MLD38_000798 [Melastoma candidum]|uniref:Uncharacterized protein n=1 Tax=Melastoma candidum TaxID=119954 RepID=A0ACB9SC55_9MYRT|nr:hypothetical protein MLD38_000798 [Melastoma candidum]